MRLSNGMVRMKPVEVLELSEAAYVFGYPLVLMELTRRQSALLSAPGGFSSSMNRFRHLMQLPDASFEAVVSPSADTLFSTLWMDLSREPLVVSLPAIVGRSFGMPVLDAWTDVFAPLGVRTTGSEAHDFVFCGPDWQGELPDGLIKLRSPTNMAWLVGSIQVDGIADATRVNEIQSSLTTRPLSLWGSRDKKLETVPIEYEPDARAPSIQVAEMGAAAFYSLMANLMEKNPPRPGDIGMVMDMATIGLVAGQRFEMANMHEDLQGVYEEGAKNALARIKAWASQPVGELRNGWFIIHAGSYGTDYLKRAGVACVGLGASLPEDWVYPLSRVDAEGRPYNGRDKYVLHFGKDEIPPVKGCWSLTLYNDRQRFAENPIHRYAVGDHDETNKLRPNNDGSIDIFIQNESPGEGLESNWLPAPKEGFNLVLRCAWPKPGVLRHEWAPPAVRRT